MIICKHLAVLTSRNFHCRHIHTSFFKFVCLTVEYLHNPVFTHNTQISLSEQEFEIRFVFETNASYNKIVSSDKCVDAFADF
jgi:hypothetical protein